MRPGLTRGDGGNAAQLNEKHGVVLSLVCQSKFVNRNHTLRGRSRVRKKDKDGWIIFYVYQTPLVERDLWSNRI